MQLTLPLFYQILLMAAITGFAIWLIRQMRTLQPNEVVEAFAKDAVADAKAQFNLTLDYSPSSIEHLERIVAAKYEEIQEKPILPIQMEALAKVWGAYLGEVIRRQRGGTWSTAKEGPYAGLCILQSGAEQICPLGKVYKRLVNGEEDNLYFYSQLILNPAALSKLPLDQTGPGSAASPPA
jgi:hypothetical protein